ncbi:SigE family RNA polymerase sigma factor [Streptosporangium sandarakinum]|uniref:RNA polymerase sigma-70 factor (Sigma-E family) n=1 Tax=Streptosporangium sandarakinum TaxID=1260955 RepID=A0A852UXN9_9ACTN|nr:SigE family RNA polymerase sigma factor [Streptosporangium sandarakinum]NYF40386.1 RNA polymerase sigma-70 factor (sigma-E family) [Streptosporangium sandarakinum]
MTEFAEYVAQRHERLRRTAYLLTRDWATAEDLVQTALARAWLAWRRIDGDPDPYVYRIIANTHASWWRRRWRGEVPTGDLPDRADAGDFTDGVGDRDALWAAIGALSARQRAVVVLHYYEGMTLSQVAGVLGCSLGAVKSQLGRALAKLRVDQRVRMTAGAER